MSDLDTLFPAGNEVTVRDEVLSIKPLKFGQFPTAVRYSKNIAGPVQQMLKDKSGADISALTITLLEEGGEDFIRLVAYGINKPVEWVADLDMDEALAVSSKFLEVNISFFAQRVLPAFMKTMESLTKAAAGDKQ